MGIRIDPTLSPVIGNPPPVGDGALALHFAPPGPSGPQQEIMNVFFSASIRSIPDNGTTFAQHPVSNLPAEVPLGLTGFRYSLFWKDFDADNVAFGRYVIRHNLPSPYTVTSTDTAILSETAGRIVIDLLEPRDYRFEVKGPEGSFPSDWYIECVKLSNEAAYDNAAVDKAHPSRFFTPEYLAEIEKWKPVQVRFMKTMASEASTINNAYPDIDGLYWNSFGGGRIYPRDVMVALCNEYDIAPWFNLSAGAEPALVENFATYVRDNLKPSLSVYASAGNEYWNTGYTDAGNRYLWAEAYRKLKPKGEGTVTLDKDTRKLTFTGAKDIRTIGPAGTLGKRRINVAVGKRVHLVNIDALNGLPAATATEAYLAPSQSDIYVEDYTGDWWFNDTTNHLYDEGYTITLTKQLKIWSDLFTAAGQRARLVGVWESQLANTGRFNRVSDSSYWQPFADYIDPLTVIDAVAINPYFGSGTFTPNGDGTDKDFTAYIRPFAVADNYESYSEALRDYMLSIPIPGVAPSNRSVATYLVNAGKNWNAKVLPHPNKATGKKLRLLAYEGGAHIIHDVLNPSVRPTDQDIIDAYAQGFLYTAEAEEVFRAWSEMHIRYIDGPLMQFTFISPITRFGAYGLVPFPGGPTDERQDLLLAEFVNRAPWWTDDYPPQAVPVPDQTWTAGVDPDFTLDDWVSNNATVFSGIPPAGMSLDGATGALTGVPFAGSGSYTFTASNYAGSVEIVVKIQVT